MLSALWITTLFVFAYVDIFGFFRADVLGAALDGTVATIAVDQTFLTGALIYLLPSILMVVLSLVLGPRANRIANIVVSLLYAVSIIALCVGETWVYYLLGSLVEVVLLVAIARFAWRSPVPVPTG
ncbi:DUF6326 family protein [Actinophytocola sp.]|uniref:DUF6326 family protein n=1 Tax=Actinophytocola sp. TaxID=1872138 RepID=UPI002ECFC4F6